MTVMKVMKDLQVLCHQDTVSLLKMMMKTTLLKRWMRMKMITVMKSMLFAEGMVPAAVILTQIQMENGIRKKNQELYREKGSEEEETQEPATEELQNQNQNLTHPHLKEELQVRSTLKKKHQKHFVETNVS